MIGSRLSLRGRLLASALGAIAVGLAGVTIAFNVVLAARLDHDADGLLQARASARVAVLKVRGGRIALPEAPDDRAPDVQLWVFAGGRTLEAPQSALPAVTATAARLAAAGRTATLDLAGRSIRLYALPVAADGRAVGAVVAGISLDPYAQTRRTALIASVALAVAVLLAFAAAARWLIDRALHPVARMTRQAAEWSERDLDRRFALGPAHDELTELAATLDGLLERLAAGLRHEQRLSAEISHELRTPLASIVAEAQHALRHGDPDEAVRVGLERILAGARILGRTLDTLMAAARAELDPRGASADALACAQAATGLVEREAPGVRTAIDAGSEGLRVAVEAALVERILAPLVENAARHAVGAVTLSLRRERDRVLFTVQDDGPGVPAGEREAIFEAGRRLGSPGPGAGLGLALCRRLARTAGGEVAAEASERGGRFTVSLPAA